MKIHKELWYIKKGSRDLSYMTYYEDNKAFESRKSTGTSWAGVRKQNYNYETEEYEVNPEWKEVVGKIVENTPMSGFKIGDCNSRWTTSNKVFEVRDPRGFTVEIPSGNLAALIQSCTISNGEVQGDCIWARDGSNHVLLNVESEPYKKALESISSNNKEKEVAKAVESSLEKGDSFVNGKSYYNYLGRYKLILKRQDGLKVEFISDSKLSNIFQSKLNYSSKPRDRVTFDQKITKGHKRERKYHIKSIDDILGLSDEYYAFPQRVTKQGSIWETSSRWSRTSNTSGDWTIVGYQEKGSKLITWADGYSEKDLEKKV